MITVAVTADKPVRDITEFADNAWLLINRAIIAKFTYMIAR